MAAQSGKLFQDILCESRAHPVESTDPMAAKTIDELKKQVSKQRTDIETERAKLRELQRSHEKEIKSIRDQSEKKLEKSLDALSRRKDDEKLAEISQVKERMLKQNQQELRTQRGDLEDEMRRLERRLTREREESMRKILNLERKRTEEELAHYLPEDTVMTREEHLKAEIFRLGEEVERLEFQVSNLQRENREQINVIKKVNHEHKMEVDALLKKNQSEAARDLAQLKLAEQIIQEKERQIQDEEYRVDLALMEKDALAEELVNARSRKTLESLNREEAVVSPSSAGKRVSMPGGGGVLQRRVEELEGTVRKLDEERRQLKQENASLRKTAVKEGGEGDGKGAEEKLKRLRKRNAELVALARQLDDKTKSLKAENEQLQKLAASSGAVASSVGAGSEGGGEKGKGSGEGESRRLSRQHAKDISDYTKQILAKDRELDSLRKKLSKYEVGGKARYEPAPDMEKRLKSMAMERLKMEKVMVQLYSKVSDPLDVGVVTKQEMEGESKEMERLFDDNRRLREEVELLKSQARMEDVDLPSVPESTHQKQSLLIDKARESEREQELMAENSRLQARVSTLVKLEADVGRLEEALKEAESVRLSHEQKNRRLTLELRDSQQLVLEMDTIQERCVKLEKEVAEAQTLLSQRNQTISQLEMNYQRVSESLNDAKLETDSLRGKVTKLEDVVKEKQDQIRQLATELDQQQEASCQPSLLPPPPSCDIALQTSLTPSPEKQDPPTCVTQSEKQPTISSSSTGGERRVKHTERITGERRVKSASKLRIKSPVKRTSASGSGGVNDADVSLDNEMRLAGYDVTDPYDSSEGVGFSDTNLEGSSVLSLDMEGVRDSGEGVLSARSLTSAENEPGKEGEGQTEGDEKTVQAFTEGRTAVSNANGLAQLYATDEGIGDVDITPELVSMSSHQSDGISSTASQGVVSEEREREDGGEKLFTDGRFVGEGHEREDVKLVDLEPLADNSCGEIVSSSSSDTGLPPQDKEVTRQSEPLTSDPVTSTTAANSVSVYIAKFSYNPAKQSPNPNYDQELSISAGDYLYVFGEMDEDGFYFSQLVTGESGLVPSNFVEKVTGEDGDLSLPRQSRFGVRSRRMSDLQDIPEVDEDISTASSSAGNSAIPPPCNLELERQFVEDDKYSVVIKWSSPSSLPQTAYVTYHVYINTQFKEAVDGTPGVMSAHLRDVPRHQLVKISVHTVTDEGESPDPEKLVILNPQYPEPPTNVRVSLLEEPPLSPAILVQWTPSLPVDGGTPISRYIIVLNNHTVSQLQSNSIPTEIVYAKLLPSDLKSMKLLPEERVILTVRAVSEHYQSLNSTPVLVPRDVVDQVLAADSVNSNTGSEGSRAASEPEGHSEEGIVSRNTERHVTQAGGYVTDAYSHVTDEPCNEQVVNDVRNCVNGPETTNGFEMEDVDGERVRIRGELRYYMATFSYNPIFHSPNETVDEELAFRDGDIIIACTEVDDEGFFEGLLRGKRGLVPSNMVELITDPEKLGQVQQLLVDQQCRSPDPLTQLPTVNGDRSSNSSRRMRARYGYDPAIDSPNDNKEDELCIQEGDIVTVFGIPDEDGYYQGELKGKRGLVPSNFLEEVIEGESGVEEMGGSMGMEIFAASEEDMEQAKRVIAEASDSLKRSSSLTTSDSAKHKKGIISKGKNLFSKGVGKK